MLRRLHYVGRFSVPRFCSTAPHASNPTLTQLREFLNSDIVKMSIVDFSKYMYSVGKEDYQLSDSDIARIVTIIQRHQKKACTDFVTSNIFYGTRKIVARMQPQQFESVLDVLVYRVRRHNLDMPMMGNAISKCVAAMQNYPIDNNAVYDLLDEFRKPLALESTRMSPMGISTILSGISNMDVFRPQMQAFLTALATSISRSVDRPFTSFELGMSLYGLRKMQSTNDGVRHVLRELALKMHDCQLSAQHIGSAALGLRNMYITHEEVMQVLIQLTRQIRHCEDAFDAFAGGSVLQALKHMNSDSTAVCKYLEALIPKLHDCRFNLIALGSAYTGLQSLRSDAVEVRKILDILNDKLEQNMERMDVAALSRISYGYKDKNPAHAEVDRFLRKFTNIVERMDSLDGFAIATLFFNLHGLPHCPVIDKLLHVLYTKMQDCTSYTSESLNHVVYGLSGMSSDHEIVRKIMGFVAAKLPNFSQTSRAMTLSGLGLHFKDPHCCEVKQYLSVYADALKSQHIDWRALSNAMYGVSHMDASVPEVEKVLSVLCTKIEQHNNVIVNDRLSVAFGRLYLSDAPMAQMLVAAIKRSCQFYATRSVWEVAVDCVRVSSLDVPVKEVVVLLHDVLRQHPPSSVVFEGAYAVMKYIHLVPANVQSDFCRYFATHIEYNMDIHQQISVLKLLSRIDVDGASDMRRALIHQIGRAAQQITEHDVELTIAGMSTSTDDEWISLAEYISKSTRPFKATETMELLADVTVSTEGRRRVYHELVTKLATSGNSFVPLPTDKVLFDHPESYRLLSVVNELLKGKLQHSFAVARGVAGLRHMTDESPEVRQYLGHLRDILMQNKAPLPMAELFRLLSGFRRMRGCDEVYAILKLSIERLANMYMDDITPHKAVQVLLGLQYLSTDVEEVLVMHEVVNTFLANWKGEKMYVSEYAAALFALRFKRINSEEMSNTIKTMVSNFVDRDWDEKHIARAIYGLQSMDMDEHVHMLLIKLTPHLSQQKVVSPQSLDRILAGLANKLSDATALELVRIAATKADLPEDLSVVKSSLIGVTSDNAVELVCDARERLGIEEG